MWKHYRATFWGMQAAIVGITVAVLALTGTWALPALVFATMQLSSVVGSLCGHHLGEKLRARRVLTSQR